MNELVRLLKAIADESRLRILLALYDESYSVCDLAKCLGIPQPTLSHHLKQLRDAGVVIGEKEGQWIHCSIDRQLLADAGIDLTKLLTPLRPAPAGSGPPGKKLPGRAQKAASTDASAQMTGGTPSVGPALS